MKTFFKVSMLGLLMVIFTAVSFTPATAQGTDDTEAKKAIYNKFIEHYDKATIKDKQTAIDAAEEYIKKFPTDKQYVDYFKGAIPDLKKWIVAKEAKDRIDKLARERKARIKRFDTAYKAAVKTTTNGAWNEVYDSGQAIISNDKDLALDVKILLASAGSAYLVEIKEPNNNFNNKIVNYAEGVYRDVSSGKSSKNFGVYNFTLKSKNNTLGEMQRIMGIIKYFRQAKKDAGVKHLYKATQYASDAQKNPAIYRWIGGWYQSKASALGKLRADLDLKTEETKEANIEKAKEYLAMEKAYVERAMDAKARAYKLSSMNGKLTAEQKQKLFDDLKGLFEFRYTDEPDQVMLKTDASINSYVSSVGSKTMPSPSTEVTPVKLEKDPPSDEADKASTDEAKTKTTGATRSRTVSKKTTGN